MKTAVIMMVVCNSLWLARPEGPLTASHPIISGMITGVALSVLFAGVLFHIARILLVVAAKSKLVK